MDCKILYRVLHKQFGERDSTHCKKKKKNTTLFQTKLKGMVKIQFLSTGEKGGEKKTTRYNYITQKWFLKEEDKNGAQTWLTGTAF